MKFLGNKVTIVSMCIIQMLFWNCKKDSFPGALLSPYIAIFDLKNIYKEDGKEVLLNKDNLAGADSITGIVVSDHSGNNLPARLLMIQDSRRLSKLRGISFFIDNATDYKMGDSIVVNVNGHSLNRENGLLQIKGITSADIQKVSSNNNISFNAVETGDILTAPNDYEATQVYIVQGTPYPIPKDPLKLNGIHLINDGFGNINIKTESSAIFADSIFAIRANYRCVVLDSFSSDNQLTPYLKLCVPNDIEFLSNDINIASVVISGFISDVKGTDANYEYIQFYATEDIDFSKTPYAVVTTNNAGASAPSGYPTKGWATGGLRTYKFNLSSGYAKKGSFFYVGGTNKYINGSGSTNIQSSNWITTYAYNTKAGQGFGTATTNLLANSGNAFGIAIFKDSSVNVNSEPVDVVFVGTSGSLYTAVPPSYGYKITNTDYYNKINPLDKSAQFYYRAGSNTQAFTYNASDLGYFNLLGGVYNRSLGRWTKVRDKIAVLLTKESLISEIENDSTSTKIQE